MSEASRDVDEIIRRMRSLCPSMEVEQLKVLHPGADDDGLWFFAHAGCEFQVQIESSSGMCPFLVETDENASRTTARSVEETVEVLVKLLRIER